MTEESLVSIGGTVYVADKDIVTPAELHVIRIGDNLSKPDEKERRGVKISMNCKMIR